MMTASFFLCNSITHAAIYDKLKAKMNVRIRFKLLYAPLQVLNR